MQRTLTLAVTLAAIAGLGAFLLRPAPVRPPISIEGERDSGIEPIEPAAPRVAPGTPTPDSSPTVVPDAIERAQGDLSRLTRAWEEGDDTVLGETLDRLIEQAVEDPAPILETARRAPALADRVFALEIALRAASIRRERHAPEEASKIEAAVDSILVTLLEQEEEGLWEIAGDEGEDVLLAGRIESIARRRNDTLDPAALEAALADLGRNDGPAGWSAAGRLLRHREATVDLAGLASIDEALRHYLRHTIRNDTEGRQSAALRSLAQIDRNRAVEEASLLLTDPGEHTSSPTRQIAARILVERFQEEDRSLLVDALLDPRAEVRLASARALTEAGREPGRASVALLEVLDERTGFPTWARRDALEMLAQEAGYRLEPPTDVERTGLVWGVSRSGTDKIGPAARNALIENLSRAAQGDPDPSVRSASRALLEVVQVAPR